MSATRMLFQFLAVFIPLGIRLSGHDQVQRRLSIPPAALLFAAMAGVCPG